MQGNTRRKERDWREKDEEKVERYHTPVPLPSVTRCKVKYSNGHIKLFGFQGFVKRYEGFLGSGNFWKILQV